jgi:hypothetical protein
MPTRYLLFLLALAFPAEVVEAQITLTPGDFPFQLGTNPYSNLDTANEDGANTDAIEAILAMSGENQTYDFTGIDFELLVEGDVTVEAGAVGPGAGTEPLSQATQTASLPFSIEEEGTVVEGTVYTYLRLTDEAAFDLGGFFDGESEGQPFTFSVAREPDGDRIADFDYTLGSSWNSAFTEVGFGSTPVTKQYEVDGWGTLVAPGIAGVPVLRVKVTEERTTAGFTFTTVCYEFRAAQPVMAIACEGNDTFMEPPTASVFTYGTTTTDAEATPATSTPALRAPYPNPARETTTLEFDMNHAGAVELVVYDVLGRPVRRVADGSRSAGRHAETLDTAGLAPGVYIARLTADGQHWTRRLVVTR